MPVLIYKRTDTSRSIAYQDEWLKYVYAENPDAKIFFDEERDLMLRPTTRTQQTIIYTGSLALFADRIEDMKEFLKCCKTRKIKLICREEGLTWIGKEPIKQLLGEWSKARKTGASMRGSQKSAATRKAATAEKLESIKHELITTDIPTKVLLARVGIKSINTIKNHFNFSREEMQRKYQIKMKRKERHEQGAN